MDGKITSLSIVVSDQKNAVEFYTEKVGFDKKTDYTAPNGYRYVTVAPRGQELEIVLWQKGAVNDELQKARSSQWGPGRSPPIVLTVTDCRATHQELSGRGVSFPQAPFDHPWGVSATFVDPDGNLFSVNQLRSWGDDAQP